MFRSVVLGFRNQVPGVNKNTGVHILRCPQLAAKTTQLELQYAASSAPNHSHH